MNVRNIPIDRSKFKDWHAIFNLRKRFPKNTEPLTEIAGTKQYRFFTFRYPADVLYRFAVGDESLSDGEMPVLGRRAMEIWIAVIALAREGCSLRVRVRATELARLLCPNMPNGGRWFSDVKRTLRCLASVEARVSGARMYRFIDEWSVNPATHAIDLVLNREALGITARWIEGGFTHEESKRGYVSYPLAYLGGPGNETDKSFHDYLLTLPRNATIRAFTLARKGCGFSQDMMKRLRPLRNALYRCIQSSVDNGDLEDFHFTGLHPKEWKSTWKVELTKPRQRHGQNRRELTKNEGRLAEEVLDWHKLPAHDLHTDDTTIHGWIHSAIRSKGEAAVRRAYENWALSRYPSVHEFWKELYGGEHALTQSASFSGKVTG